MKKNTKTATKVHAGTARQRDAEKRLAEQKAAVEQKEAQQASIGYRLRDTRSTRNVDVKAHNPDQAIYAASEAMPDCDWVIEASDIDAAKCTIDATKLSKATVVADSERPSSKSGAGNAEEKKAAKQTKLQMKRNQGISFDGVVCPKFTIAAKFDRPKNTPAKAWWPDAQKDKDRYDFVMWQLILCGKHTQKEIALAMEAHGKAHGKDWWPGVAYKYALQAVKDMKLAGLKPVLK